MLARLRDCRFVLMAILVHVLLVVVLVISTNGSTGSVTKTSTVKKQQVIAASAIPKQALEHELARLKKVEQHKKAEQLALAKHAAQVKRQLAAERRKAQQLREQRKKRLQQERAARVAREKAEQKRLALQKQEQLRLDKLRQENLRLEKQRKQEQQALALAQVQKQAQLKQLQVAKQQLAEQRQAHEQYARAELKRFSLLIKQKITNNWVVQGMDEQSLLCKVAVRLAPDGMVVNAQITQQSGSLAYDSSCLAAMYKSEPFPVPDDPELFEQFRELHFSLTPEEILSRG